MPSSELLSRFAAIVGDKYAVTDPATLAPHLVEQRGLFQGNTPMMLRPGSVAEVQDILTLANETGTGIVPQGGNTGMSGGAIAFGEIILSLTRLDRIRELDTASNTLTCEAGTILANVQDAAEQADRLFPLSLGAEGSCTIGGNLSTNAGGTSAIVHGTTRDLVLGVEVVLADGRMMNALNKLKKDNTGYDLKDLFVGAEGTLGIITAAVLKLFPRPKSVETAFVGVPSPRAALDLLGLLQERAGASVTSFELIARICVEFAIRHGNGVRDPLASPYPWYVLVELSSQLPLGNRTLLEEVLEAGMERGFIEDAMIAESLDQANALWSMRQQLTETQKPEGGSIKHDVSVPVSAVPDFIAEASEAVVKLVPGARPVPFGHLGDGNIHFNVSQPVGADKARYMAGWTAMNEVVHGIAMKYRGSISAEHGIGKLKRDLLPKVKDPVALEVMRALKKTLDPKGILNPGKVL